MTQRPVSLPPRRAAGQGAATSRSAASTATVKVSYDFEGENLSADLPVYLIPTSDKGLAGGIRVGWSEEDGAQYGVFVTSKFTLSPR